MNNPKCLDQGNNKLWLILNDKWSKILSKGIKFQRFFTILFTLMLHYGNKCITKSLPSSRSFISYIEIWKMIIISIFIRDYVRLREYITEYSTFTSFFTILFTLKLHYGGKCITKSLPSSQAFISYIGIWKMIGIIIFIEDYVPLRHGW